MQVHAILNEMTPDDRTRLLEELPAEVTRRLLEELLADRAEDGAAAAGLSRRTRPGGT